MEEIRIVPTAECYVEGLHHVVDVVARERRYIGFVEGPPLDGTQAFVRSLLDGAGVQFLALDAAGQVAGWCDIVRPSQEGFRHGGRLGMGLLPHVRGQGLGRRLARQTLDAARAQGLERIELEVFASNSRAIALYEKLGFLVEGVRRRARKLDGQYEDNILMALLSE